MKIRSVTMMTRKERDPYGPSIYRRTYDRLGAVWENIFMKPLVVLFFLAQVVATFLLAFVLPMAMGLDWGVNGWLILLYEVVVLYGVFLLAAFWVRTIESYGY